METMALPDLRECRRLAAMETDGTVDKVLFSYQGTLYRLSIPNKGDEYAEPDQWLLERETRGDVEPLAISWPEDEERAAALVFAWATRANQLDLARKTRLAAADDDEDLDDDEGLDDDE